jgi:hypothetical protein
MYKRTIVLDTSETRRLQIQRSRIKNKYAQARPSAGLRKSKRKTNERARVISLMLLGGKCNHCGINDMRVLQIDHVNGGGNKEYKAIHPWGIVKRVQTNPHDYQALCANCNWIKRFELNETVARKDS